MHSINARVKDALSHMPSLFDSHSDYGCWIYYEDQMGSAPSLTAHAQRVQAGGIGMEVLVIGGQSVLDEVDFRNRDTVLTAMQSVRKALSDRPHLRYARLAHLGKGDGDESLGRQAHSRPCGARQDVRLVLCVLPASDCHCRQCHEALA